MSRRTNTRAVGVKDLKNRLSEVLRRVRKGEAVTVTDRSRPVAILVPLPAGDRSDTVRELVRAGRLAWAGSKPTGSAHPSSLSGPSVSDAVVEDRR